MCSRLWPLLYWAQGCWGFIFCYRTVLADVLPFRSVVVTWLGIGLTLPFYGAEVFGLHALGKRALAEQSAEWIALADDIRYGSGFLMILAGLLLIGIGSILVVMVIWKSGALPKWAGLLFTMGFLLYLPQFLGTQPLRRHVLLRLLRFRRLHNPSSSI